MNSPLVSGWYTHTHTDAPTCRDRGTKKLCFHLDESRPPRPHMEWPARCRGSGALRRGCPAGTPCLFAVFRLGRLGLALGFHFLGSAAQELGQLGPPQGSGGPTIAALSGGSLGRQQAMPLDMTRQTSDLLKVQCSVLRSREVRQQRHVEGAKILWLGFAS